MKVAVFFPGRITSGKLEEHLLRIREWPDHEFVFFASQNAVVATEESTNLMRTILSMTEEGQSNVENTVIPDFMFSCRQPYLWSQFYHNKKCMDMVLAYQKRHHMYFDIVMKYRADVENPVAVSFEDPKEHTWYIPSGFDYFDGINDRIVYGDVLSMICYCSLIDHLEQYHFKSNVMLHPESLLGHHRRSHIGLNVIRFPYDCTLLSSRVCSWTWN